MPPGASAALPDASAHRWRRWNHLLPCPSSSSSCSSSCWRSTWLAPAPIHYAWQGKGVTLNNTCALIQGGGKEGGGSTGGGHWDRGIAAGEKKTTKQKQKKKLSQPLLCFTLQWDFQCILVRQGQLSHSCVGCPPPRHHAKLAWQGVGRAKSQHTKNNKIEPVQRASQDTPSQTMGQRSLSPNSTG